MPNPLSRRLRRRWLPQSLAVLLGVMQVQAADQVAVPQAPAAPATQAPPVLAPQLPIQQSLKILVLAGSGESNDLERHVMAPLVVQVLDQNERAVEGAQVVFRFPINGPSAAFTDGKSSITVITRYRS